MKVNRNTTIGLGIISIVLISLITILEIIDIPINSKFESIIFNILCGCVVSIVMCIVNYKIEKSRIEETIFQQLISYYHFLWCFYQIPFEDASDNKEHDSEYKLIFKLFDKLCERNRYYASQDKNLDTFIKTSKTQLFNEVKVFSYGIDIENIINENLADVEHNCSTKREACKNIREFTYSKMKKTDSYMKKIEKYKKNFNWNKYKEENSTGFYEKD